MFLRCKVRRKDGKQHLYWSVVENTRGARGRVVQGRVLYLGEINDTQELPWRRSIAVLADGTGQPRTLSLFPEDRCEGLLADASIVRVKLSELRLRRPRQWGACWLALLLWRELQLDQFWCQRPRACESNRSRQYHTALVKRPLSVDTAWGTNQLRGRPLLDRLFP